VHETSTEGPLLSPLGGGGGGGGGEQITYVTLMPRQAAAPSVENPVQPPPVVPRVTRKLPPPQIREIKPQIAPRAIETQLTPMPAARAPGSGPGLRGGPGAGTGTGGGIGSGQGTGVGSGVGPGIGGENGDILPPSVRYTFLPPQPVPEALKGRSFQVLFRVDSTGNVQGVDLEPIIEDASYRRKFLAAMRRFRFNPATRRDGTAVPGQAVIGFTL